MSLDPHGAGEEAKPEAQGLMIILGGTGLQIHEGGAWAIQFRSVLPQR
jgi:hypothetical protein